MSTTEYWLTLLIVAGMGVCIAVFVWLTLQLKEDVVDEVHGVPTLRSQVWHVVTMALAFMGFLALGVTLVGRLLPPLIVDAMSRVGQ